MNLWKKNNRQEENNLYKKRRKRYETTQQRKLRNDLDRIRKIGLTNKKFENWNNEALNYKSSINYSEHPNLNRNIIWKYFQTLSYLNQ